MEHLHGPQTQVYEGAYAIKVSMKFALRNNSLFILLLFMHGPCHVFLRLTNLPSNFPHSIFECRRYHHRYNLGATVPDRHRSGSPKVVGWAFSYPHILIDHSVESLSDDMNLGLQRILALNPSAVQRPNGFLSRHSNQSSKLPV